ncbi:MAG TPA: bifunctional riboflavin kinase/FAD synthetase [Candidatus Binatia bacterium]|jgi:riboflavin kinase/FMN adenylyltransferase|nr:bifunctional riboflavin kinase/FAD synthetase [Candidatus Binatia bacterium]
MQIYRHIEDREVSLRDPILTMGNFDGVHLGHQALLSRIVKEARERKGSSTVLTFEPHPLKILAPNRAPRLILAHKDKMRLLQSLGIDVVIIQTFNSAFANLEAEEFVRRYLVNRIKVRKIWVGKDLRFGKARKGRVEDLIRWGKETGFEVGIIEPIQVEGERISSSRIRELLLKGEVHEAERFLGRYHFISGRVVRGHQRGRQLGFPTANIMSQTEVLPADGIYATLLESDGRRWPSVSNIGINPTFGSGPRTIESYLFEFSGDLYGQTVRLFFVKRIREEKKFSSAEVLVEQMKKDVASAQEILSQLRPQEGAELSR